MRGWILALTLALSSVACSAAAQTDAEFSNEMLARFSKKHPQHKFEISEPLTLHRDKGGDQEAFINLHRIWLYCKNVPADCERSKDDYVQKTNYSDPVAPAASQLRIMVRDREYVGYLKTMEAKVKPGKEPTRYVYEQIGDDLFAIVAVDIGDKIAVLMEDRIAQLGLDRAKAFSLAMRQTRPSLGKLPEPSVFVSQGIGFETKEYGSALLYDREGWSKIADAVGPDLFVTVVSDQFVFSGKMADGADLTKFRKTVEEDCAQQERCISPNVYRFREGRWVIAS